MVNAAEGIVISKRFFVRSVDELEALRDGGFRTMWSQLGKIVHGEDSFIKLRPDADLKVDDFTGLSGLIRRYIESCKVSLAKISGQFDALIKQAKQVVKREPVKAVPVVEHVSEEETQLMAEYEKLKISPTVQEFTRALDRLTGPEKARAQAFWANLLDYTSTKDGGLKQLVEFLKNINPDFEKHPPLTQIKKHFGEGMLHV